MKRILLLVLLSVVVVPVLAFGATWQIDPDHSSLQFKVSHLTVSKVKGDFGKFKGTVTLDESDLTSLKVELTAETASVNTGHAKRDEHLRNEDFFYVAKYPNITFVSKKIVRGEGNRLKVVGDLSIRGVTKEITVDVEGPTPEVKDPWGNFRRGATGTSKINRKDFGILWNSVLDSGGLVVGDDVEIYVEVELIKK
jgi:polyisoprenoid-binding protein YceI